MDQSLTPVRDDEDETFDYLTKTDGAKAAIDHLKKVAELTHKAREPGALLSADLMPVAPTATP